MDGLTQMLIKKFAPQIAPALLKGEVALYDYLNTIELLPGETHAGCILGFNSQKESVIVIVTFSSETVSRKINSFKKDDLIQLIQTLI